jgi:hypothetical protein
VIGITIIAPHYFQDPRTVNSLNPFLHLVHTGELDANKSFLRDGQAKWSPAIFQVWVRRDHERAQILVRNEHPDWEWLPKDQPNKADHWIQMYGNNCGDIKRPDNLGRTNDPTFHQFIRAIRPGTIDRLKALDWRNIGYPTTSSPRIHKCQIVAAYTAKYDGKPAVSAEPPVTGNASAEAVKAEGAVDGIISLLDPIVSYEAEIGKLKKHITIQAQAVIQGIRDNSDLRDRVRELEAQLQEQKRDHNIKVRELEAEITQLKSRRKQRQSRGPCTRRLRVQGISPTPT